MRRGWFLAVLAAGMAESVADIALDADDLFEPKTGIGVKRKAELADVEPVEDTAVGAPR